MLIANQTAARETEVFDAAAVAGDLEAIAKNHADNQRELRLALSRRLKLALLDGRNAAERLLIDDRGGRRCA